MCDCNHAFHADVVGSLLRPAALKTARQQFQQGDIDATELRAVEDQQIRLAVAKQQELGLAVVTDG
ncbi:5-methyltetrahydropteroyltriglutamate--homocysteine methyltransferase [compost metagenome]